MRTKCLDMKVKAAGDGLEEGQFSAIVSVFGNVDSYGDVVMPGAFADTIKEKAASGGAFPVVFAHGSMDADNFIGKVIEARETDEGLYVKGQLYTDTPNGAHVQRLFKDGVLDQFSFAYGVQESAPAKRGDQDVLELLKLDLYEAGPVLVGANQETRLIGVKSGRAISAKNETAIKSAMTALDAAKAALSDVLAALGDENEPKTDEPAEKTGETDDKTTGHNDGTTADAFALESALLAAFI